jgi:carbonic anhydrase
VVSCGTVRVHHSSVEQPPPATAAQPGQPEAAPSRQAGSIADAQQPGLALHPSTRSRRHGLVAVACACCVAAGLTASRARPAAADGGAGSFAYSGAGGPEHWPGVCVTGIQQSPIVLPARGTQGACDGRQQQPAFSYAPVSGARVKNTGTTLQVSMADAAAADVSVTWGGRQLQLLQYHFHTPSEHAVGGARAAMEAHLVHRDTHSGEQGLAARARRARCAAVGGASWLTPRWRATWARSPSCQAAWS